MKKVIDLTRADMAPYRLAETIEKGNYPEVLYFEFHKHLDPINEVYESGRLSSFHKESKAYYKNIICSGLPDDYEAVIDIALNIGGQWFIFRECGANYYLGFGPQGILALRKACSERNVPIVVFEEKIDDWLESQETNNSDKRQNEFELIMNIIRNMTADFERRPKEYANIKEESIRDRLLAPINGSLSGRANAEAKNVQGKTDILVRTASGENEFIFELKIWKGLQSFIATIKQLQSYLVWSNNQCGIVMISRNKDFSKVISDAKTIVNGEYKIINSENERELKFRFPFKNDANRFIELTVLFVNLHKG